MINVYYQTLPEYCRYLLLLCTDRLLQYADAITRLTRLKVLIYYILYGCIFYMNLKNTAISHFHKA